MALGTTNEAGSTTAVAPNSAAERYHPFGSKPRRNFVLVLVLPILLLYASGALVVYFALGMMASEIDRQEAKRGVTAMRAAIGSFLSATSEAVADEGIWTEAYLNVVVGPDPAWMDTTWGATARLGLSYDDVMVTDQAGLIQFGENNLGPIRGDIAARFPAAASMLTELDAAIARNGDAAVVAHFAASGRTTAALAAISIHKSTPGEMTVPVQQRRILWIARNITASTLQDFALRYQLPIAQMVTGATPGQSAIDIMDGEGKVAGTLAWTPEQPGETAFRHAGALAFAIYLGIGLLLLFMLAALRKAMLRRAASIAAAFAERPAIATSVPAVAAKVAPVVEPVPAGSAIEGVSAAMFTVDYQPVLDLRSETMVGAEALLRWTRTDGKPLLQEELSPRDCAAMMDRAGIIALRHATGELAPLLGVTLSLAVTPQQLMNPVFAEKVIGTLGATNFQLRRLQLSIDATLMPPAELIAERMAVLRRMGIALALSNFILSDRTADYLRPGFADRICLAPGMVPLIDADPARHKLLEATVEMARAASLAVTVPNVQRKEEAAKFLRLGCREFRGSLLAPPMGIAALTALILAPAQPVRQAG